MTNEQLELLKSCANGRTVGNASYSPDWQALYNLGLIRIKPVNTEKYRSGLGQHVTLTEAGVDILLELINKQ